MTIYCFTIRHSKEDAKCSIVNTLILKCLYKNVIYVIKNIIILIFRSHNNSQYNTRSYSTQCPQPPSYSKYPSGNIEPIRKI